MTLFSLKTINCDAQMGEYGNHHAPGCPYWIGNEPTAAGARRMAKDAGWVRRDSRDYSPECWAAMQRTDKED